MNFYKRFFDRKVECSDFQHIEEIEEEDDVHYEEETHESSSKFIPSFQMLFHGLKNMTMTVPQGHQIKGFRLKVGTPLS